MNANASSTSTRALWRHLGGDDALVDHVATSGPDDVLASRFEVTAFAAASVGVATLAAAELLAARSGSRVRRALVDTVAACAAFKSEALFEAVGWERPPVWDPLAGDYRARDGFVRLHTNYARHRDAVLTALGVRADRDAVRAAVAERDAAELEAAVVDAGGCAAAMHARDAWLASPHGIATRDEPPVGLHELGPEGGTSSRELARLPADATRPLEGLRVLDLTRVLAGPVCTRFLAAHGADVLRLDPPGFEEVPAVVPDVTAGKRCAALDLKTAAGLAALLALAATSDVLVSGYRPGALEALGLGVEALRGANPALVIAQVDAYGWAGPWRERRGFDSLVQMSTGIAAASSLEKPVPLPAQALDHGAGYLLAAGVCRALVRRAASGRGQLARASLVGAANHLFALGLRDAPRPAATPPFPAHVLESAVTAWGPARRVPCPGVIDGCPPPAWTLEAGPLGASAL